MPSGLKEIVFPTKESLEKDWEKFVEKYNINDPDAYLNAVEMPYSCLASIQIGIGTACNYNCPMCFNHYDKGYQYYNDKELSFVEVERIVKNNAPINDLTFSVSGEPFLHSKIFEMLDMAKPYVKTFSFSTNAALLSPDKVKRLESYPIKNICVSVDGSDKETYERFRKNGKYEVFKKNVHNLAETFGEKVVVAATVFNENRDSILGMPALCNELNVKKMVLFRLFEHPKANEKGIKRLRSREMREFMLPFLAECEKYAIEVCWDTRAVDLITARTIKERTKGKYAVDLDVYKRACTTPFHNLLIDPEGNYNFCCALEPTPGNSLITPARELFNSREIRIMRVMNLLGRFPYVCRKYCNRVNDWKIEVSLENLKRLVKMEKFESMEWKVVEGLNSRCKVAIMTYSTMTRDLLSGEFFNGSDIIAVLDREHKKYLKEGIKLPLYGYDKLLHLDYDTIIITSGNSWREILFSFMEENDDWRSKNLYRIDNIERVLRRWDPVEL